MLKVLKHFAPLLTDKHVMIRMDNKTTADKSPSRCLLDLSAGVSQELLVVVTGKSVLHQSSLHSRQAESGYGPDVMQRPSSKRVEAGLSDPNNMGQLPEGRSGSVCLLGEHTVRSVVLHEPAGFIAVGRGCLLPPTIAQDSLICLSTSSSDSLLISAHSGRGTDSHSGGSRTHERNMVPITDSAAVGETVAASVAQRRTLSAGC